MEALKQHSPTAGANGLSAMRVVNDAQVFFTASRLLAFRMLRLASGSGGQDRTLADLEGSMCWRGRMPVVTSVKFCRSCERA